MGNSYAIIKPLEIQPVEEEIQPVEEVASNSEESDNETDLVEIIDVYIDNELLLSPFVKEVSSDDFRAEIEEYWLRYGADWIEVARKVGIDFIQQKCLILGFEPETVYLAVIYLTRFLSTTQEKVEIGEAEYSWFVEVLLSVACLSLSAKMGEVFVPALSSFCMNDCFFDNGMIMKMELTVLKRLRWEMGLLTPFDFTGLFAIKLTEIFAMRIESSRVGFAILRSMEDARTMYYRPSVVALAATLVAVNDYSSTTIDAMRLRINPLVTELAMSIYEVILCYIRVRGLVEPLRTGHLGRRRVSLTTDARGKGKRVCS